MTALMEPLLRRLCTTNRFNRVVAQADHDGRHDGDRRDHHGQGFHEAAQHQVEDHHDQQHPARRQAKAGNRLRQRVGQPRGGHDEVQEAGRDNDQHDHRRGPHRAFQHLAQHRPVQPAEPCRKDEGAQHAQRGGLGGCRKPRVNGAHHQEEDAHGRRQMHQAGKSLTPGRMDLLAAPRGFGHAGDHDRQHEQSRHRKAGDDAGQVQLGHRRIRQHAIDDQVDRGRNQDAQRTAGGQAAQEQGLVIAILADLRNGDCAHRGRSSHAGARRGRKQRGCADVGMHQPARQPRQPQAHRDVHAFGKACAQQHFAQHDEQGNRHQQELVVRAPGYLADGARQRQHRKQRVQDQAQHTKRRAPRNGQADQHQQ
ncbi:hypothetical protein G6F57_014481 [Rhizopus arrhizus]|nr:hypothetical protein G6F57_014481 [Rhizopus arrhizus]